MSEPECDIILIQAPERVTSFFTGKEPSHEYKNRFVVASGDRQKNLLAAIGESRNLYESIWRDNGLAKNFLMGGAEIHLLGQEDGRELVICGGSLDFGGVDETVAQKVGHQVKEVLLAQGAEKKIIVSIRDLVEPIHPCFSKCRLQW